MAVQCGEVMSFKSPSVQHLKSAGVIFDLQPPMMFKS